MKQTTLHPVIKNLGGKMVPFAGYEMPVKFSSELKEHKQVRESVGIFDVSHMGEIFVTGKNAFSFCNFVTTNDVSLLKDGDVQYTVIPNKQGGAVDDATLFRFSAEKFMFCVNASNIEKDFAHFQSVQAEFPAATILDESECWDLLAVQGPNSRDLLNKLSDRPLEFLRFFQFAKLTLAGIPVILSRTGYTGELGFEIFVKPLHTIFLYEKILKTGESFGILPIGLGARDTLRLEMGMILYGNDLSENWSPIEASLAWCVRAHKGDFLGRETIVRQMELGTPRKLVGISMIERGIPRRGYRVMAEQKEIGEVTSGSFSPTLNQAVALAYIDSAVVKAQKNIGVEIRDKILQAKIVKIPFIKPSPSYRNDE